MPTFKTHKLTVVLPFLVTYKTILGRRSLHRRNLQHCSLFLQPFQSSVYRCPSNLDLFSMKELHKLIYGIKCISIFLAGIPELFSAAWYCISFFLPLYSYSLLSTAPYMADLNLKTVFILHSNKNSVKIFLGENNFWYVLIKALYLYFLL